MAVSFLNPSSTASPALSHFFCSTRHLSFLIPTTNAFSSSGPEGRVNSRGRHITRLSAGSSLNDKQQQSEQLDVSVLRFTLGIPGLDESYLPRYLGLAFGSLILLNHFLGTTGPPSAAQMRTEVVGICLATFSTVLPYLGKFLKGAGPVDRSFVPEGNKQIFVMPDGLQDVLKEDLAWGSYVLLRNTNTILYQFTMNYVYVAIGMW